MNTKSQKQTIETKNVTSIKIFRYENKVLFGLGDYVGIESRITVKLANGDQVNFPCTAVHLEELALGAAFSQNSLKCKSENDIQPYDQLSYEKLLICYQEFSTASPIFCLTGSVHSGQILDVNYKEIFFTEDMSRHNVIDKIIGFGIKNDIQFNHCILMISSRMPLELIEKAYKSGIRNIASVSAPTKDAVLFARGKNINLIGMYRDSRFNVYTK